MDRRKWREVVRRKGRDSKGDSDPVNWLRNVCLFGAGSPRL